MGTRTVRLDEDAEKNLEEIRRATGLSVSAVLKKGLAVLRSEVAYQLKTRAYDIYQELDLGPGGYSIAPANRKQHAVREAIKRKLGR